VNLNTLISNNSKYLIKVARNITGKKDAKLGPELFTSTYLEIYEKGIEYPKQDQDFIKWFSKYMKYRFMPNGTYTREVMTKECLTLDIESKVQGSDWNSFTELITDPDAMQNIELCAEEINDRTKELIEISSSLGTAKTFKYIQCLEFRETLPDYEKYLFDLYFDKKLSTKKIAVMYSDENNTVARSSVDKMINSIRAKIKIYKWE